MVLPKAHRNETVSNFSSQVLIQHLFVRRLALLAVCAVVLAVNVFVGHRGIIGAVEDVTALSTPASGEPRVVVTGNANNNNLVLEEKNPLQEQHKELFRKNLHKKQITQLRQTQKEITSAFEHPSLSMLQGGKLPDLNDVFPRKQQSMDFDPSFVLHFNITTSRTRTSKTNHHVVQVGRQGPSVLKAITHGVIQRRLGFPRELFDTVAASKCLGPDGKEVPSGAASANNNHTLSSRPQEFSKLPDAILIGVQKGGTTALYDYLDQHPRIARSQKEFFFLDEQLDATLIQNRGKGIPQYEVQRAYQRVMTKALKWTPRAAAAPPSNVSDVALNKMILDLTPHYILDSDRIPARISCIVPWAKLFALFRNPIDRARSQYDMKKQLSNVRDPSKALNKFRNPFPTFDEYVQNDIAALKETGVIQDWSVVDFDDFWDTPAMWEAWRTYLHSGLNAPVGMGLYALQLKPFLELSNDLLVLRSEDLQTNTNTTYQKVLDFLGLPHFSLGSYPRINTASRKEQISNETRALLSDVFEPFNRKLEDLLGKDWEGVWT